MLKSFLGGTEQGCSKYYICCMSHRNRIALFTRIQGGTSPPPSQKIKSAKIYFTLDFIQLIYTTCQNLSTVSNSITVSIFTVSSFIFHALISNIPIVFTAISQHIIKPIHCIGCTALLESLHRHI